MGTGELARYARNHGTERVAKFAFLASLEPFLVKTDDNPTGVDKAVFDGIYEAAYNNRYAWYTQFYKDFYNLDTTLGERITSEVVTANWNTAVASAPEAAYAVVPTWIEDFRPDVAAVRDSGKPTLIVHGTADAILPIDASGRPFHAAFPEATYTEIDGAPHGLLWTHAAEVNEILLGFVKS